MILTAGCTNTSFSSPIVMFRKDTCWQDKKGHWSLFRWQIYLQCTVIVQKEAARESANRDLNHRHIKLKKKSRKKGLSEIFHHHIISCQLIFLVFWERFSQIPGIFTCKYSYYWNCKRIAFFQGGWFIWSLLGQLLEWRHKSMRFSQMTIKCS